MVHANKKRHGVPIPVPSLKYKGLSVWGILAWRGRALTILTLSADFSSDQGIFPFLSSIDGESDAKRSNSLRPAQLRPSHTALLSDQRTSIVLAADQTRWLPEAWPYRNGGHSRQQPVRDPGSPLLPDIAPGTVRRPRSRTKLFDDDKLLSPSASLPHPGRRRPPCRISSTRLRPPRQPLPSATSSTAWSRTSPVCSPVSPVSSQPVASTSTHSLYAARRSKIFLG